MFKLKTARLEGGWSWQ